MSQSGSYMSGLDMPQQGRISDEHKARVSWPILNSMVLKTKHKPHIQAYRYVQENRLIHIKALHWQVTWKTGPQFIEALKHKIVRKFGETKHFVFFYIDMRSTFHSQTFNFNVRKQDLTGLTWKVNL